MLLVKIPIGDQEAARVGLQSILGPRDARAQIGERREGLPNSWPVMRYRAAILRYDHDAVTAPFLIG